LTPNITFNLRFIGFQTKRDVGNQDYGLIFYINDEMQPISHQTALGQQFTYQFPLARGKQQNFTWVYHQGKIPNSVAAVLSKIDVYGSVIGSANNFTPCPVGYFSSSENSKCQKCSVGSITASPGTSLCSLCHEGSIAPNVGMNRCINCGTGTYNPQNQRNECITSCEFNATEGNNIISYSLQRLSKRLSLTSKNLFAISLCNKFTYRECQNCGEQPQNYFYFSTNNTGYGLGSMLSFNADTKVNFTGITNQSIHAFDISYYNPPNPPPGCFSDNTLVMVEFYCSLSQGSEIPELVDNNNCNFNFRWTTNYACRLCTEEDIVDEHTECQDGKQTVVPKKINMCNGILPDPKVTACESVTVPKTTALYGVIVVGSIVLVLIVVLVYMYRKKRHFEIQYQKLALDQDLEDL